MTAPSFDRLDDLLADAALDALDATDRAWLDAHDGTERGDAQELEAVAALIACAAPASAVPASLTAALTADAAAWQRAQRRSRLRQRFVAQRWTWSAAVAAALLLTVTAWWMVRHAGADAVPRTPAQQRAWILAHDDAQQQPWTAGRIRGSATWSTTANCGMLTLANAPINDRESWRYGLFVHDGSTWHPFGRFDVTEAGCTRFIPIEPTDPFPMIARVTIAEVAASGVMPATPQGLRVVVACEFAAAQ